MKHIVAFLLVASFAMFDTTCRASTLVQLAGSIYRQTPRSHEAKAVSGAAVLLHPAASLDQTDWVGPVYSDAYGRFAIGNLKQLRYLMRIYDVDKTVLWEQIVVVPSKLPPIIAPALTLVYYPKGADGSIVDVTLAPLGFPYRQQPAVNTRPSNSIWFGDGVLVSDVKRIAIALLNAGVKLRAIRLFKERDQLHSMLVEVGSSDAHGHLPVLTVAQVRAAGSFPCAQ